MIGERTKRQIQRQKCSELAVRDELVRIGWESVCGVFEWEISYRRQRSGFVNRIVKSSRNGKLGIWNLRGVLLEFLSAILSRYMWPASTARPDHK